MTVSHGQVAGAPSAGVKAVARFVLRHGGFASAVLENLGRAGTRVVLIGEDGTWGDYVVSDAAAARALCEACKVDVVPEWNRELAAAMPYRRTK